MLCRSTLAEQWEGTLSPSRFGVWTSSVSPIKDFTMNRRRWWHGGLTLPWKTAQSRSIPKDATSHFLQWTCIKEISYQYSLAGIWPRFGNGTFIIFYIKGSSLRGSFIFFIPFPNSSAAFVISSELSVSDFTWYSSDLMECTFFTSSTIARLSAQRRRASWDYIFAFYGRCVFHWLIQWLNWYHVGT